ncbi:MAG TPA: glycosyltransferase 87 family protein [Solirubrobacterales bacterium]|nr:glycosyltransferase 87 family protein [Solirubrobacterales bacterium]
MTKVARLVLPVGLVTSASAWLAAGASSMGDWPHDAGRAVRPLAHGDVGRYLSEHVGMGPVATLVQAPFAALAGGGELSAYRWACFPCLLVAGMVGLYLAGIARRRGVSRIGQALIASLFLVNPLTVEALQWGHPEEILTAALAVAAVAAASEGKPRGAAALLGLALASKQWALIAILPTLMALPGNRFRTGAVALAVAAALMLPGILAAPGGFADTQAGSAHTKGVVTPWSFWYAGSSVKTETVGAPPTTMVVQVHRPPPLVAAISRPLIVLLAFAIPIGLGLRRRSFALSGPDAMALLALLALLRCFLDPVDNVYYHAPLLLAVIGWDALACRGLPLRSLLATAVAFVFREWSLNLQDLHLYNYAYISLMLTAAAAIVASLRPGNLNFIEKPEFSGDEAQVSGIKKTAQRPINAL